MKTQKLIVIVIAILSISGIKARAQEEMRTNNKLVHQISIHVNAENNVSLYADHLEKERSNYILKIYSEAGEMVFASTYAKKGSLSKSFDLSELPQGKYEFIVYNKLKPVFSKEILKQSTTIDDFETEPMLVVLATDKNK